MMAHLSHVVFDMKKLSKDWDNLAELVMIGFELD